MGGRVDLAKLAWAIETDLERTGSPERAAGEKRYLKSDMDFLGATLADILDETEFFIRKAIGWVLRETSKTRPDEVYRWIVPRTHRAPGVTMRETVKYLDATWAERLMRAYREGRTAQAVR